MDRHFSGTRFGDGVEQDMDFEMGSSSTAYFDAHHHIPQDPPHTYIAQSSYALPPSEYTSSSSIEYQTRQRAHQRNHSSSTQSSYSSGYRSSSGSSFSQWQPRLSAASTNSTWSQFSGFSEEQQHVAQTGCAPDSWSGDPVPSDPPSAATTTPAARPALAGSTIEPSATRPIPRPQQTPKKEPFQTCVSRKKRSRSSQQQSRYWCTSCKEGFKEKYDWKRHEETYQERTEMFACELCNNVYFLDKDFVHHHQKSHRCRVCAEKQHVELARKPRMSRTGWGCGFCNHFSSNWTERCNHISKHFEKEDKTMDDWHHSQVIFSLLQRPEILRHWCRLLEVKQRTGSPFRWRKHDTGRVEGFPESNCDPQLQDLLEYYTPEYGSTLTIVRLAFDTGLREKELPSLPVPEEAPEPLTQPPPQRISASQTDQDRFSQNDLMGDVAPWSLVGHLGTIPEDPFQPTDVCTLDYDALDAAFNDGHGYHSFPH
ncbi:hypothetical protein DM02DRAFT_377342 [Periconia macrospinosa]|uniref:C2H2-type domain-containing protein n=1 Tax=Periconia macrospinosa TaxID=97972 RepID=A0A2V1E901_9PLEO|nr:hypothetical protein DM02DRAFT_377342 [Periconia macrospinosa]